MLKTLFVLGGIMLLAFVGGIVYGYIRRLLSRIRYLRGRVRDLKRENDRLKQQLENQFDRACNLNVALGESRQSVEQLQIETAVQQRQLAIQGRLLQTGKEIK